MRSYSCPKCGTAKTRLAPRHGVTDRLLSTLTIYPLRCQLCAHRFTILLGKLKANPRRNYDWVPVQYPAQVRPVHDPSLVDGALVRSRSAEGIGLRFSSFLRSEERRLRRILDLRLPDHAI